MRFIGAARASWRCLRRTIVDRREAKELRYMDDRMLADMGLTRFDVLWGLSTFDAIGHLAQAREKNLAGHMADIGLTHSQNRSDQRPREG
jgi:uncharacterized protein YjiS (DUF1127 family)